MIPPIQKSPRRGIEPRSPAWQAGILTTILSRMIYYSNKIFEKSILFPTDNCIRTFKNTCSTSFLHNSLNSCSLVWCLQVCVAIHFTTYHHQWFNGMVVCLSIVRETRVQFPIGEIFDQDVFRKASCLWLKLYWTHSYIWNILFIITLSLYHANFISCT